VTSVVAAPAGLLAPGDARPVRWRYHFTDARLGVLTATLPLREVSLSDVLSGAASGAADVPLADVVRAVDPFGATIPRKAVMWAERQELDPQTGGVALSTVEWGGLVQKRTRSLLGRSMKLDLVTWPSYLARRLLRTWTFAQVDKFVIFRSLLGDAVEQPAVDTPDPGVYDNSPHLQPLEYGTFTGNPYPGALAGNPADRSYLASDLKPALEALTELGNSEDGFDWRLVPYMATPGDLRTFRVRLDLGYPRLGRTGGSGLRWSTDRAEGRSRWGYVADLSLVEDGSAVNNRLTAVGSGSGADQIRATADSIQTSRDEMRAGYLLYEGSVGGASNDDRTYDTVYGKALGALLAGFASEITLSGIKVRGDLAPTLPTYTLGDDLTIKVGEGLTGRPVTFIGQLIGRTVEPAEPGRNETVTLDVQGTVQP
jgi:hypothetical protein